MHTSHKPHKHNTFHASVCAVHMSTDDNLWCVVFCVCSMCMFMCAAACSSFSFRSKPPGKLRRAFIVVWHGTTGRASSVLLVNCAFITCAMFLPVCRFCLVYRLGVVIQRKKRNTPWPKRNAKEIRSTHHTIKPMTSHHQKNHMLQYI